MAPSSLSYCLYKLFRHAAFVIDNCYTSRSNIEVCIRKERSGHQPKWGSRNINAFFAMSVSGCFFSNMLHPDQTSFRHTLDFIEVHSSCLQLSKYFYYVLLLLIFQRSQRCKKFCHKYKRNYLTCFKRWHIRYWWNEQQHSNIWLVTSSTG